jgi:flagellar assembly protein FliH
MAAATQKFLFDDDFGASERVRDAEKRDQAAAAAELAEHVAAAEQRGYQAGFAAAQREAQVERDRRSAMALEQIAQAMQAIAAGIGGVETRMETEAVDVAFAVARKLCGELVAAEPLAEITALVSDCFHQLVSTPHLAVRINDGLYEAARERIELLAKQSGFAGRLVLLSDPEIAGGDCKIEWADGGVVLERAAIEAKINELVGRYMASRGGGR